MADWKQITARIRRARGSRDPGGQLALLFEKTKDAMVAFELGRHFEVVRDPAQALQWYQVAFPRFRRGDWKTKTSEAILRLGGEVPVEVAPTLVAPSTADAESAVDITLPESALSSEQDTDDSSGSVDASDRPVDAPAADSASPEKKRRRRGRRGGRNRNKKAAPSVPSTSPRAHAQIESASQHIEIAPPRSVDSRSIPRVPVEQLPETSSTLRGRFGDPGLSSRLSLLEMQLRRLLTCPPAKLDHAQHAPVGPGVFVLTDDDMTTYYYVEACDTLRIAIATLARSGTTRRNGSNLKPLLADHLGIAETRVSKYLADHCVVRWLQLDEGAPQFAHFAIAVLRPTLNE